MKWLTVLSLLLTGCGNGVDGVVVDPAFTQYVSRFERITGTRVSVSVVSASLEHKIYGRCKRPLLLPSYVQIDIKRWERLDEASREVILFHELGHCVLGLRHQEGTVMAPVFDSVVEGYAKDPAPYLAILSGR